MGCQTRLQAIRQETHNKPVTQSGPASYWVDRFIHAFPGETYTIKDLYFWIFMEKFGPAFHFKVLERYMLSMGCKKIRNGTFLNPGKRVEVKRLSNDTKFDSDVEKRIAAATIRRIKRSRHQ